MPDPPAYFALIGFAGIFSGLPVFTAASLPNAILEDCCIESATLV